MSALPFDPVPAALVDGAGRVVPGVFREAVADESLDGARFGWLGRTAPARLRSLRLKQWQHFAVISPELMLTFAVVDAGYLRAGWVRVRDLGTGEAFEREVKGPPTMEVSVARGLWDGRTRLRARGLSVEVHNHLDAGVHEVQVSLAASKGHPEVEARFVCEQARGVIEPLVVNLPLGRNRAMYSHKVPLPVHGEIRVGERRHALSTSDSLAILDIHKAHYPRHTWWKWATLGGFDARGRILALNLTENVARHTERWTENVAWVDGRCHRLSRAVFGFDPRDVRRPWHLATEGGEVELEFRPAGGRQEKLDLGPILRSKFDQLDGTFHGTVRAGGETLTIDGLRGLCEDHDALW